MANLKKCKKKIRKKTQPTSRSEHAMLHVRCLYRLNKQLMRKKIALADYLRKGWFYTKGIWRAITGM